MFQKYRKYFSLITLAACVSAAIVFKRFVFVAYYPVLMSAVVAFAFGSSLFRKVSLCESLALSTPPFLLPDNARGYCRKLTAIWCGIMILNGCIATATVFAPKWVWILWNCALSYCMTLTVVGIELLVRRKKFSVVFTTSGSTSTPKRIVKPFSKLAKEVLYHKKQLRDILSSKPVFLATIEEHHMYGTLWCKLLPKAAECEIDKEVIFTPEALIEKMKSHREVILITTPTFLSRFTAYAKQYDIPKNVKEIITSGALLTSEVSKATKDVFGIAPREIFGSTETGGVASRRQHSGEGEDWKVFDSVKISSSPEGNLIVNSPFSIEKNYTMGDGVIIAPDGRSFKLLGRTDRMVKISEERVSLPEMEEKMVKISGIKEVALCPLTNEHGPYLGAVIVAEEELASQEKPSMFIRNECLKIFPKGTAPKKYRFVPELPRNAQGKIQVSALKEVLNSSFRMPLVFDSQITENSFTANMVFPSDMPCFKGHFNGYPVLAGVVQVGVANNIAQQFFKCSSPMKTLKKIKFTGVITPGKKIAFSLTQKSQDFTFSYSKGESQCSSGILSY
ncbi:MAG: AMP-binding protein [Kiritimatiellae bacterium]|nr:AMP-binding protein [Kiritimatiellia bacterium]